MLLRFVVISAVIFIVIESDFAGGGRLGLGLGLISGLVLVFFLLGLVGVVLMLDLSGGTRIVLFLFIVKGHLSDCVGLSDGLRDLRRGLLRGVLCGGLSWHVLY